IVNDFLSEKTQMLASSKLANSESFDPVLCFPINPSFDWKERITELSNVSEESFKTMNEQLHLALVYRCLELAMEEEQMMFYPYLQNNLTSNEVKRKCSLLLTKASAAQNRSTETLRDTIAIE